MVSNLLHTNSGVTGLFPSVSQAIPAAIEPNIDAIIGDSFNANVNVEYANKASPAPTGSIILSANESIAKNEPEALLGAL